MKKLRVFGAALHKIEGKFMGISHLSMIPIPGWSESLLLLIIIGLIVLVIYKAKIFKASQTPFPMKWFCFYTYFLLPFKGLITLIVATSISLILSPLLALIVAVFIGLHKRKLWGWYLNWILLIIEVITNILFYPLEKLEKNPSGFAAYLFAGLVYTVANVFYFRKRKVLFA